MTTKTKETTPMMKQWLACKQDAGTALLLFRLGDFYEAFYEDAESLASNLMITLTKRGETPMAGIPCHAIDGYLEKLIEKGLSVALAEQTEISSEVKGIVGRKVKRIITPATFTSGKEGSCGTNNFLLSISYLNKSYGIAYTDTSTSEFFFSTFHSKEEMVDEILRLKPKEILISSKLSSSKPPFLDSISLSLQTNFLPISPFYFDHKMCIDKLQKHLKVASLDGFGMKGETSAINACGALFSYLENDIFFDISIYKDLRKRDTSRHLKIDGATLSHLEVLYSPSGRSLFDVINHTKTAMGERLLKSSLLYPLLDKSTIIARQKNIQALLEKEIDLDSSLSGIKDIERLITKIASGKAGPTDLYLLALSLKKTPTLIENLQSTLVSITAPFTPLTITDKILHTISLQPGNYFIGEGIDSELDRLKEVEQRSSSLLKEYEERCKETLGIKTLKIGHSRSFGYFLEVSKKATHLVPDSFTRKQTLVNGERYITEELRKIETEILTAKEKALLLEQKILNSLIEECTLSQKNILQTAVIIAKIDLIHSLKKTAMRRGYICPTITDDHSIEVEAGAHPILLKSMKQDRFIPNDISLNDEASLAILTGPNMAGKSTYIKSVALLTILAQIGSFIPAKSATIGVRDKIFTRIGALDDLQRGHSTFMMEMTETANILRNATSKSLIILDEIGRGTGTFDGISIAKSIATFIATHIKALTLFATHYLELTELHREVAGIKNIRSAVSESGGSVTFLHKIEDGEAASSYGIFVGELAGLPRRVILDAKAHLTELQDTHGNQPSKERKPSRREVQFNLFAEAEDPITEEIKSIDPNDLTPFKALEKIIQWKKSLT